MIQQQKLYTVAEAANALRISRAFVYRLMGQGEIASVKLGGARRVLPQSIEAYLDRLVAQAQAGGEGA